MSGRFKHCTFHIKFGEPHTMPRMTMAFSIMSVAAVVL